MFKSIKVYTRTDWGVFIKEVQLQNLIHAVSPGAAEHV